MIKVLLKWLQMALKSLTSMVAILERNYYNTIRKTKVSLNGLKTAIKESFLNKKFSLCGCNTRTQILQISPEIAVF